MSSALEDGRGRIIGEGGWSVEHRPAVAAQATVTRAAAGVGVRNICRSITACVAAAGTPQTPIQAVLRDGASGVGDVLWSGVLAAPANSGGVVALPGLSIVGSANTPMTLEFTGAGVAGSYETVAMSGIEAIQ